MHRSHVARHIVVVDAGGGDPEGTELVRLPAVGDEPEILAVGVLHGREPSVHAISDQVDVKVGDLAKAVGAVQGQV